jgi:hypothetical protein
MKKSGRLRKRSQAQSLKNVITPFLNPAITGKIETHGKPRPISLKPFHTQYNFFYGN